MSLDLPASEWTQGMTSPYWLQLQAKAGTDGPRTRSLTGDVKMVDRPASTFGAQCGAQVGLSAESDFEKWEYKLGTPSGEEVLLAGRHKKS